MESFSTFEQGQDREYALFVGDNRFCLNQSRRLSFEPPSLKDLALQRMELGLFHQASWTGSRTTCSLIVDGEDFYLTVDKKASPLNSIGSQEWHYQTKEIPFLKSLDEVHAISIPNESFGIAAMDLGQSEVGEFLFGESANAYGEWLARGSIEFLPIHLPPASLTRSHEGVFIRPLVMRCTDNWSGIISQSDLQNPYGVRAWRPKGVGSEVDFIEEEIFTADRLKQVAPFYGLEDRAYSFKELHTIAEKLNLMDIFGLSLRIIRGGSLLPASYATFDPNGMISS